MQRPYVGLRRIVATCFSITLLAATVVGATDEPHAHDHAHGEEHEEIERIVVTLSPLAHEVEELAVPVDQLDREKVIEQLGATIGDTLRNVPGVTNSGFSGGVGRPVIRGQDAFRTEVLEGGLSTQDASRLSPDHAVPVNPLAAQHIEVVRGPGVLRYGGGSSAGVVNAITNRVPKDRQGDSLTGEVMGIYGDNADQRDLFALLDGGYYTDEHGDFAWHFDTLVRKSDDYQTGSRGKQEGTSTEAFSVSGGASWFFDKGRVGVAYSRFENVYGIPEDEPVTIDMKTDRVRVETDIFEPIEGIRKLTFRGVYSDYTHDEVAEGVIGQTFNNHEFEGRLEALHDDFFGFVGAAGLHGKFQDLKAGGEAEAFLAPSDTSSIAFYIFEERPLSQHVDLELGFRTEGVWVDGTPRAGRKREKQFAPLSGSAALVYHTTQGWTLGLTGLVGQRAPSQVELFARGPHEATGTFEIGDADFDEETSYTGELRIAGNVDRVLIETTGFVTRYNDFIFGQLTGRTVDDDGDPAGTELDELSYKNRNVLFYGAEVQVSSELFRLGEGAFSTEWQFDYVRARFTGGGNRNVPRITPIRWGGRLNYERERVKAHVGFLRTESQRHGSADEFETGSFTMLELGARYQLPAYGAMLPLELGMTARNLLDQNARNAVSFNKEGVLSPGRSFLFSVNARF